LLALSYGIAAKTVMTSLRCALAPKGRLRVSLNMANPMLTGSHTTAEKPAGVTIDLSRELARRLDVELEFLSWKSPGEAVDAVAKGLADIGYLAIDPSRAEQVQFTAPYAQIVCSRVISWQSSCHVVRAGRRTRPPERSCGRC
jgi:polar amino acid transport system substrate-binding protein